MKEGGEEIVRCGGPYLGLGIPTDSFYPEHSEILGERHFKTGADICLWGKLTALTHRIQPEVQGGLGGNTHSLIYCCTDPATWGKDGGRAGQ